MSPRAASFLRLLARVELRALAAVLLVSAGVAACMFVVARRTPGSLLPAGDWAKLAGLYAAVIGTPLAAAFGAPAYALLRWKGIASWPLVLGLGAVPGLVTFLGVGPSDSLGGWVLASGVAVAALTHVLSRTKAPAAASDQA